ncbi:unnamed protein product [Durusdinium trenchii]|uniref:Uncharacterized protein n=2 Tax=Durusdinium trenchii TaxID=1381693 RepID=A0ABP0NBP5_9DINO
MVALSRPTRVASHQASSTSSTPHFDRCTGLALWMAVNPVSGRAGSVPEHSPICKGIQ